MDPIKLSIILPMLLSLSITAQAQQYNQHICSNTTTFPKNSAYQANLNTLLFFLSSNATRCIRFHITSVGQNPNTVYGLFLCRGDYSPDVCKDCVSFATQLDLVQRCPVEKEALIWYDQCLVRYSNRSFFSTVDLKPTVCMWNVNNITDVGLFKNLLNTTMRDVAAEAASASSGTKKFAVKEVDFTGTQKLYNLVQCIPDLSKSDCNTCLQIAISRLPNCSEGRRGGRVLLPSCSVRYETYLFYNATATRASPPSPMVLPPAPAGLGTRTPVKSGISTVTKGAIVAAISVSIVLFGMGYCFLRRQARKKYHTIQEDNGGNEISSLQFDLSTIETATKNFSDDNKLGQGGFGQVYKGTLPNGQEIAVKRLSRSSRQGAGEFKNEVLLLAKLQHRNLVKVIGFCLEGEEKIIVYEFVPNKSLQYFLFDPEKQGQLDWRRRWKIIEGIARGFLYLHEDSQPRIIHRDLKVNNILLDQDMNPKIADFGMARIFGVDQSQGNTSVIAGTFSRNYKWKKISSFNQTDSGDGLVSYVWTHWKNGTPMDVLDPILIDSYSRNEVLRCIQIGLLCVQRDPADRPTMAAVILMLDGCSATIPVPQPPAFFLHSTSGQSFTLKALDLESDQSASKSAPCSVNEASITELHPR